MCDADTIIFHNFCHRAVFLEWCGVQEAAAVADDVLIQMIHKYMQLCEASQHIYSMGSILHKKVCL